MVALAISRGKVLEPRYHGRGHELSSRPGFRRPRASSPSEDGVDMCGPGVTLHNPCEAEYVSSGRSFQCLPVVAMAPSLISVAPCVERQGVPMVVEGRLFEKT